MVKTNKYSRFVLRTLEEIRDSKDVVLQIEDTDTIFSESSKKCYLCEVVAGIYFDKVRKEDDLITEICDLNAEKRKLEKTIRRLENKIHKIEESKNVSK